MTPMILASQAWMSSSAACLARPAAVTLEREQPDGLGATGKVSSQRNLGRGFVGSGLVSLSGCSCSFHTLPWALS